MAVVVVGLGNQGSKRQRVAGGDVTATVDPVNEDAEYRRIEDVPLASYDRALVCAPDGEKLSLLRYLLANGKHVLVEKPLLTAEDSELLELQNLADEHSAVCYTAYNHRFEPHIIRLRTLIESGKLGQVYLARMFYGNGTARDVRNSVWRDAGPGVLGDLGSHLLDLVAFFWGHRDLDLSVWSGNTFENRASDHVLFGGGADPVLELETTLVSWRNHFSIDIYGELGTAHVDGLCKWGPSHFTMRTRALPSGKPDEETITLENPDPTWAAEYAHFAHLCERGHSNLENDIWLNRALRKLSRDVNNA